MRLYIAGPLFSPYHRAYHAENVQRLFLDPLPENRRGPFVEDLRTLSHNARDALPRLR